MGHSLPSEYGVYLGGGPEKREYSPQFGSHLGTLDLCVNIVPMLYNTAAMALPTRLSIGDTMRMRIAIIAASAGTFALAQTDPAPAAYAGAAAFTGTFTFPAVGSTPIIKVAEKQRLENNPTLPSTGWAGSPDKSGSFQRLGGAGSASTSGSFQRLGGAGSAGTSGSFHRLKLRTNNTTEK